MEQQNGPNVSMEEVQQWLGEKEIFIRMQQRTIQQLMEENKRLKEEIQKMQKQ